MSYQVLARKWRPRRFDDVAGQPGVTRTLKNAIESGRIAQSYVFSGPRGVGKTTTARILARALNCAKGPTSEPCGECDACIEIAEGRDLDVLEIDAATHTQIDKVRETIINALGFAPARDRYKIFIIDEIHRLSQQSFDALLKSIEEPPPHVIFMMATTELEKVPATIQSRSQVFELRSLPLKLIVERLREIANAEGLDVDDAALVLVARAADGSMRDALSALDQVVGFAGTSVDAESVTTVLGLVRRDIVLDIVDAVAREDGAAIFELAGRAVEAGYDLRQVCRELARAVRDLLVVSIDPKRVDDPEIAHESERARLVELAKRFSYEDLMRAFDVLARAEFDIRGAAQPRFHLEMALLRWIHLRKLVPLTDLIATLESGGRPQITLPPLAPSKPATPAPVRPSGPPTPMGNSTRVQSPGSRVQGQESRVQGQSAILRPESKVQDQSNVHGPVPQSKATRDPESTWDVVPTPDPGPTQDQTSKGTQDLGPRSPDPTGDRPSPASLFKDAFLARIRQDKKFFYGTVVAQAQRIDVTGDQVTFAFASAHKALRAQLEQSRPWLEGLAENVAGRRVTVQAVETAAQPGAGQRQNQPADVPAVQDKQAALRARALENEGVQALLDVFGGEIKDIEEM